MYTQHAAMQSSRRSNRFLDSLLSILRLKNDAALARLLSTSPSNISKVRRGYHPVSASLLLQVHEITGMDFRVLRALMEPG
jgi:transcriptional regulator with XRE-family HTH domain